MDLIFDEGLISPWNGTGDLFQLNGVITAGSASTIYAKQGVVGGLARISLGPHAG